MDTRRAFLKKAAYLAGAASLSNALPPAIARAMAINPAPGSSFYDAEHIVLLMQENRSFDHAFGTLQGVRGFNDPRAVVQPNNNKVWLQTNKEGQTFAPFRLDIRDTKVTWMGCLPHGWTDQTDAYHRGKMDRWLDVKRSGFKEFSDMPLTMGHYTREDIPFYYALADAFTVCDQHFCASLTGTNPNRLYFWSGNIREGLDGKALVWNGDSEFSGKANWRTFPERLSEQGVAWKVYQNEISASSAGYSGEENSWLSNFGCNALEYFPQYAVKYSARYKSLLTQQRQKLLDQLAALDGDPPQGEARAKLQNALANVDKEIALYGNAQLDTLPEHTRNLHRRAFVNNAGDPDYMQLETMHYRDGDTERELRIPKGDILHQFRQDVASGELPTVSWLVPPQLFSDHPDSPWFGSWYVSEVMDILTQHPEVWKKTIFILTYDENDGYFDHVAPFGSPNPYQGGTGKVSPDIDAHREFVRREDQYHPDSARESNIGLGYRVPMVIASPWTRGGWVNSQVFDHTSPLQFLEKFVSRKVGAPVAETNISSWRRAVCGDLTSAFRPYNGEQLTPLAAVEKAPFLMGIHRAKFKDLPTGYRSLSGDEITAINQDPRQSPWFPQQEPGVRNSNALPYELYADGHYDPTGHYRITFKAGRDLFGDRAVGSPFKVYAQVPFDGEAGRTWDYAASAGSAVADSWPLSGFANGRYQLAVYGPNGFYRLFKGGPDRPAIRVGCTYRPGTNGRATLLLTCTNTGDEDHRLQVVDNSYGSKPRTVRLPKGKESTVAIDLSGSYRWYDVSVRCMGIDGFEEQFAGRVEIGADGITDPLMGVGAR